MARRLTKKGALISVIGDEVRLAPGSRGASRLLLVRGLMACAAGHVHRLPPRRRGRHQRAPRVQLSRRDQGCGGCAGCAGGGPPPGLIRRGRRVGRHAAAGHCGQVQGADKAPGHCHCDYQPACASARAAPPWRACPLADALALVVLAQIAEDIRALIDAHEAMIPTVVVIPSKGWPRVGGGWPMARPCAVHSRRALGRRQSTRMIRRRTPRWSGPSACSRARMRDKPLYSRLATSRGWGRGRFPIINHL